MRHYTANAFSGGVAGALDFLWPGDDLPADIFLNDGDLCTIVTGGSSSHYRYDITYSGDTDSVYFNAIKPVSNTGLGGWLMSDDQYTAMQASAEFAIAIAGLLAKEIDTQRFSRHQQGEFTIYNRGIKSGISISKSATVSRNVSITAVSIFIHGQDRNVLAQTTGTVPDNTGGTSQICYAYLTDIGGVMTLAYTALGDTPPSTALGISSIVVPAGNTAATDPYLANCTITTIARTEANWPMIQESPDYKDITPLRVMSGLGYSVTMDVMDFEGGEYPTITHQKTDKTINNFRVYLSGMADAVNIKYVTHLMEK